MSDGWIKLHRSVMDNGLWKDRPFTKGQAWIDLLLCANHKPTSFFVRGIEVTVGRGQVARSLQFLAERWGWSVGTVRRFQNELQNKSQIEIQKTNVITLISIVNYSRYQETEQQIGTQNSTQNERKNGNIQECLNTIKGETAKKTNPREKEIEQKIVDQLKAEGTYTESRLPGIRETARQIAALQIKEPPK